MIKTRSLSPYFGKYASNSWYRADIYLKRRPLFTDKAEEMMFYHDYGYSMSNKSMSITNAYPGREKFISTENRYKPNFCDHNKYRRVNFPFTYGDSYAGYYYLHPYCRVVRTPAAPYEPYVWAEHLSGLNQVTDDLRAEAYWNMKPKFEGEVSLLNFLFELKDFRDIAKTLFSTNPKKNPLVQLADRIQGYHPTRKQLDKMNEKPFREPPTKSAAEARLLWSFAIVPTINDVKAILKQAHTIVDKAQQEFITDGEVGNTRHSSHQFDPVASYGSEALSGLYYSTGNCLRRTFTVTASMKYKYSPRSKFNAFCTYWGLVPTYESVWNMLPFSFLVDYGLEVAKSLKRMRLDPNLSAYMITDYQESFLTMYESGYFARTGGTSTQPTLGLVVDKTYYSQVSADNRKLLDGYQCSYYKRWLNAHPYYGPALPSFKMANKGQLLNMAALARCLF